MHQPARILVLLGFWFVATSGNVANAREGDYLVVIHGWSWLRDTMRPAERHFEERGFQVVPVHYDSRSLSADEVVQRHIAPTVRRHCTDPKHSIHFIGHSMGGLLIRKYLATEKLPNLGRVVFLGTPNQGIELVDRFGRRAWFRSVFGEPAQALGTDSASFPRKLGPANFGPGIVMGTTGIPLLSLLLPGPDDGIVAVHSGRVEGMRDLVTIPGLHMTLPGNRQALEQASHFINTGRFQKNRGNPRPRTRRKTHRKGH